MQHFCYICTELTQSDLAFITLTCERVRYSRGGGLHSKQNKMKAKVLNLLKPKVKDLGFNDEELLTVCEGIANGLASVENVTDDDINARIEAVIPVLKLSQSASNRSYEKMKKQFEEEWKKNHPEPKPDPKPKDEPKKDEKENSEWFTQYKDAHNKEISDLKAQIEAMKKEKANEGFLARAKKGLANVDSNYYSLMLKGRSFANEEEVDAFVKDVNDGWDALKKARNIQELKTLTPPGARTPAPSKPSELVQARIDARNAAEAAQTNTVVKGLK